MSEAQPSSQKEPKRKAPPTNEQLPFLVEFTFTAARLTVLFAGVFTTTLALLAHANPWTAVLRGAGALIITGLLAWIIVTIIGNGALEAAKVEIKQTAAEETPSATLEKEA